MRRSRTPVRSVTPNRSRARAHTRSTSAGSPHHRARPHRWPRAPRTRVRRTRHGLPLLHREQILGGHTQPTGDPPMLRTFVVAGGQPADPHDDQLAQPWLKTAVPEHRREQVVESTRQRRMIQKHLKDGQFGHVVRYPGLVGGGLGLLHRQPRNTALGQGVITPCTGGASSRSSAMAASRSSAASSPTQRRGKSANGYRPDASRSSAARYAVVSTPRAPTIRSSFNTTMSGMNPGAPVSNPRLPATTTVPAGRASSIACAKARGALAVTSTTTSASPPVASRSAATGSSTATSTARSAPNRDASASRSASLAPVPVSMTKSAPASLAPAAAHSPRMPGPRTATTSPGPVAGIVAPQRIPAPSGLNTVARTGSSAAGTGSTIESGARYWYSA